MRESEIANHPLLDKTIAMVFANLFDNDHTHFAQDHPSWNTYSSFESLANRPISQSLLPLGTTYPKRKAGRLLILHRSVEMLL